MSSELDLICRIVGEYYGEIVESVSLCVAKFEPTPFRDIVKNSKLKMNQVKKALSVLVQHGMVTFNMPSRDRYALPAPVNYVLDRPRILTRLRYPSYIYVVEKAYGYEAELIIEEILKHGQVDMNTVIANVHKRVASETPEGNPTTLSVSDVYDKFVTLAQNRFICRCQTVSGLQLDESPNRDTFSQNAYVVPNFDESELKGRKRKLSDASAASGPPSKKQRTIESVYWQLNIQRFHESLRDRILVDAIGRKYGKSAADIVRTILKQNDGSGGGNNGNQFQDHQMSFVSLSLNEIMRALPVELKLTRTVVEQNLKILTDSAGEFVCRTDDSSGGVYQIDFLRAFNELCASHVESVVAERFGSLSHRIFRLLLVKQHLDEKEILSQTMIADKSFLRRLLDEKFVSLTVVPSLGDYNPKMSTFLFCVDLKTVAQMLLKRSYKSLNNLMSRRQSLTKDHESLVKDEQRIEYILHELDPSDEVSREEYEAQISPADRAALKKYKLMVNKLEVAELQIDDTIFVLETYLGHMKSAWTDRSMNDKRTRSR